MDHLRAAYLYLSRLQTDCGNRQEFLAQQAIKDQKKLIESARESAA